MNRARTYRCTRIRRWVERSNDTETLPLRPFCRSCIIATRGYDFRKGQGTVRDETYTEAAARLRIAAVSIKIFDLTNLVFGSDK